MGFDHYISHPGTDQGDGPILLTNHLRTVSQLMYSDLPEGVTTAHGGDFQTLARITGRTHDLAKATTWAQQHLRGIAFDSKEQYRYHAFPSALVTLYCAELHDDIDQRDAGLATLVVARHHGRSAPPDPATARQRYTANKPGVNERYRVAETQFCDIARHQGATAVADQILAEAVGPAHSASWDSFLEWYDREDVIMTLVAALGRDTIDTQYYSDLTRLWSVMKYADQLAASLGQDITERVKNIDSESVWTTLQESDRVPMRRTSNRSDLTVKTLEDFIQTELPDGTGITSRLNDLRTRARTQALNEVDTLVETDDAVGLITLPTGFGKTFAGLGAGLRASALTKGRLIYVLPYTSILDQTAAEIERVFDVTPTDPAFTLHHHLSTTFSDLGERYTDADIGRSVGTFHAESWRSALTLTTTVQLFESLTAPTGRQATKLPALQDSVIVLDEPQAIPEQWWKIIVDLIEILVTDYDATVMLMTATQPQLIKHGEGPLEPIQLVGESSAYVDFLKENPRVDYVIDESIYDTESPLEYRAAADRLADVAGSGRDTLAICNTRASARALHTRTDEALTVARRQSPVKIGKILNQEIERTGTVPDVDTLRQLITDEAATRGAEPRPVLAYLSGDIRPSDRQLIIDALYDEETETNPLLASSHQVVLVSTSVVEAGVDISFDEVYRDIAPIPSLVQSGGRCNRSFDGAKGRVTVWMLAAPDGRTQLPARVIHNSGTDQLPLLHATKKALDAEEGTVVPEGQMVGEIVKRFYRHINTQYDPGSDTLAEHINQCRVDELTDEHMIEEIESYEDVVICSTTAERRAGGMDGSSSISEETLLEYVGARVSAQPPAQATIVEIGNSEYYLIDAQSDQYDPVFGLLDPD